MLLNGIPVLLDGKMGATEEQIETREIRIMDFDKKEYLAQHIILSTTSTRLGSKIKELKTTKEMWEVVVADVTTKNKLFLLDAEEQLMSMKLSDNDDSKAHLIEIKQHFQVMLQCHENLIKIGSTLSDTRFNTLIMMSLPESYCPTLQTITAAKQASALTGTLSQKMKANNLIAFLIEEAQHQVINDERTKNLTTHWWPMERRAVGAGQTNKNGVTKADKDTEMVLLLLLNRKLTDDWTLEKYGDCNILF